MSLVYFLIFKVFDEFLISGTFRIGRAVDLAQLDLIVFLLWRIAQYEWWRCKRLKRLDRNV